MAPRRGGGRFSIENPRRGGGSPTRGGGGLRGGGPGGCLQGSLWEELNTIGAKMITCRKNCFEQLIFELHRITVHLLSFARINFRL